MTFVTSVCSCDIRDEFRRKKNAKSSFCRLCVFGQRGHELTSARTSKPNPHPQGWLRRTDVTVTVAVLSTHHLRTTNSARLKTGKRKAREEPPRSHVPAGRSDPVQLGEFNLK